MATDGAGVTQAYLWPNGVIPFTFSSHPLFKNKPNGMPSDAKQTAMDAMAYWINNTDIYFVERTAANAASYPDYIEYGVDFSNPNVNCSSSVGRKVGKQLLNDGGCSLGALIHELGHTVGLRHEHQRKGKTQYVQYFSQNVLDGMGFAFDEDKSTSGAFNIGPYDYGSIMHYGCRILSQR